MRVGPCGSVRLAQKASDELGSACLLIKIAGTSRRDEPRYELVHTVEIDGFRQVACDARIIRCALKTFSAQRSNCDYRYVSQSFGFANPARCSQTVEARQIDIHQDQIRKRLLGDADGIFAIRGGDDLVTLLLQREADHCEVIDGVIDDEYQELCSSRLTLFRDVCPVEVR